MRLRADVLAAAVLGAAQMAAADFVLSYRVKPQAPDTGHWTVQFFARNDGNHGSGVRLLDDEIELVSDQKMVIGADEFGDPDILGFRSPDFYNSDRTFINIIGNYGDPENHYHPWVPWIKPDLNNASQWLGGVNDLRVVVDHLNNHGVIADQSVNGGLGVLIATAVVPNNATYVKLIPWGLGGETGPAFGDFLGQGDPPPQIGQLEPGGYNQVNPLSVAVPEPTAIALALPLLGAALWRRRRQ